MRQKQLWESDERKDEIQWPVSLRTVTFFQSGFSHTFCWSKPISGTFGAKGLIISGF